MTVIFKGMGKAMIGGFVKIYPTISTPVAPTPTPDPAEWTQYVKFGNDSTSSEYTGSSVAISDDGNWVLMGALGKGNDDQNNINNWYGAAYLFNWDGSDWIEVAKLTCPDGEIEGASFGSSVALNSDGTKIAVGASFEYSSLDGSVYTFVRSGSTVTPQSTIVPAVTDTWAEFGQDMEFSSTGDYLVVGSPFHNSAGRAYVFFWNGSDWVEQGILDKPTSNSTETFGYTVSIDGTGTKVVVGEPGNDDTTPGKVYVYSRSGSTWSFEQLLTATVATNDDYFGFDVSLSNDGNYIAVGAPGQENGAGDLESGAAYIFNFNGSSWVQEQFLKASDNASDLKFGSSVSLNQDGSRVVVGANSDYFSSELRASYIFDRTGSSWAETIKILPESPHDIGGFDYREYGNSIAMSNNGLVFTVGAPDPGIIEGSPSDTGKIYIYKYE